MLEIGIILLALLGAFVGARSLRRAPTGNAVVGDRIRSATVKHIIDGDTVIVGCGLHKLTLRLDGIDCPEIDQLWGDIAKYGLIKLIGGRKIRFEAHALDKFGRTLATVYVPQRDGSGWLNVNSRMVMLGHAWVCRRLWHLPTERRGDLEKMERWARAKRVGLWRDIAPVAPWEHRAAVNSLPLNSA